MIYPQLLRQKIENHLLFPLHGKNYCEIKSVPSIQCVNEVGIPFLGEGGRGKL